MSDLLFVPDIAERLGVSSDAVRALIRRGSLPPPARIGRRLVWRQADFERWLDARFAAERGEE